MQRIAGGSCVEEHISSAFLRVDVCAGQRVIAGEVKGLPPIRHIAAGQSHALLSDGERVWAFGRMLDSTAKEASTASWTQPQVN